jgi:hypothetical protein
MNDEEWRWSLLKNLISIISFACGLIALVSIGIIIAAYNLTESTEGFLFITDGIMMPIRNISVVVALITVFLALREIKKKGHTKKGKWLAWMGILISAGILLSGVFVSFTFLISRIFQ